MNKDILGLWAAFMVGIGAAAQQVHDSTQVRQLKEVVVSDSRFELKRENSGKTVIKITSQELERNQGKHIAEIINSKSGLEITGSRGREGSVFGVFARGGRGRQVLILIDGVRVADPSSSSSEYDLRLLSSANIESIEIIKGAASTLYGTNAATAVINITTKEASKKPISGNFLSSVGTNQTSKNQNYNLSRFSNNAQINGSLNKFSYAGSFSNRYAEGLSDLITPVNEKDDFSQFSTDLRFGYRFSDHFDLSIFGNLTKARSDYDESFGLIDAPYQFLSNQKRLGFSTAYTYGKGQFLINGAYSEFDSENISAFPAAFHGTNYVVDAYHTYTFNNAFYSVVGLNYINDATEFADSEDFTIIDPYLNIVYVSNFGLNMNFGGRLNHHSSYGNNFVYNLNPSFSIKTDEGYLKILTSFATSYITPSLTQLYGNFGANPDLEPEDNRTFEAGLEYARDSKLRISGLYFNRKEENFVYYDLEDNAFKNAANTINAEGVELELDWSASKRIEVTANYTFTERKGDNAIRIPKHKVNFNGGFAFSERTYASFQYQFTGKRKDTDFNSFPSVDVTLDNFSLLNVYLSHECIPDKLKFYVAIDNLLNEEYMEVLGYTTRGRNLRLGINLTL